MNLAAIFRGVAIKRLAKVEVSPANSNQHEFNGVDALRGLLGTSGKTSMRIAWRLPRDGVALASEEDDNCSFYDSRERRPHRGPEWRLVFGSQLPLTAGVGDALVLCKKHDGNLIGMIFPQGSTWLSQAELLFDFRFDKVRQSGLLIPETGLAERRIDLAVRDLLDQLAVEYPVEVASSDEDLLHERFPTLEFPSTKTMSRFAREVCIVDTDDPDELLLAWLQREEQLFYALERLNIQSRLQESFSTVEDFLSYSLSVQNRRKSRMGHSLENHLEELFLFNGLRFERNKTTERRNKPDFLFPGQNEYLDETFDPQFLLMLAAKSTAKDRWRQALTEADRIKVKHLCTLEPGISQTQTDEMLEQNIQLVVPAAMHTTYTDQQLKYLWSIRDFVDYAVYVQRRS